MRYPPDCVTLSAVRWSTAVRVGQNNKWRRDVRCCAIQQRPGRVAIGRVVAAGFDAGGYFLATVPPGCQATTPITRHVELLTQDQLQHDFGLYAPWDVALTKTANATQLPHSGGWVTYTFCVINTGQTPLSKLTVHDLSLGRVVCTNPVGQDSLLPGDGCSCQTTAQIVTDTINVATAIGVPLQVEGQPIPGAGAAPLTGRL